MHHLKIILCLASALTVGQANAQAEKHTAKTKKAQQHKTASKPTSPSTRVPVTGTSSTTNLTVQSRATTAPKEIEERKQVDQPKDLPNPNNIIKQTASHPYKAAVGIKFLWGISATGKYFLKEDQAIEAIIRYRSYSGIGKDIAITALYQFEKPIPNISGLHWLAGAGPYFGHFSYKSSLYSDLYPNSGNSFYGVAAIAGLEYKIATIPLAISADWMPAFDFNGGGFGAESGGIGVKYTF